MYKNIGMQRRPLYYINNYLDTFDGQINIDITHQAIQYNMHVHVNLQMHALICPEKINYRWI